MMTRPGAGMHQDAADQVAALILGLDGSAITVGHEEDENVLESQLAWAKAQASDSSGGRI